MIITDTYAIGHIPKTGGDAAKAYFKAAGVKFDSFYGSISEPKKHWWFKLAGIERDVHALTIRRLPHKELSNNYHPMPAPHNKFYSPDEMIELNWGEKYILKMMDGKPVTEWLRSEFLLEDITAFITRHHGSCPELRGTQTKGVQSYDHDIWKFWSPEQVRRLYTASPTWAAIERELYGKLVGEE